MKKIIVILVTIVISFSLFGGGIKLNDAEKVAKSFYYQRVQAYQPLSWDNIRLLPVVKPEDGLYPYYIFNVNEDEGFIMVSSINSISPVLAYSFEGPFNMNNMSPAQESYVDYYASAVNHHFNIDEAPKAEVLDEWQQLLAFEPGNGYKDEITVGPFLLVKWNQDHPYNAACPLDSDCNYSNGRVYVGCVAIAMVQVMKFYNWPATGEGSKTHMSFMNGGYGNITINYAQQSYNWYEMTNTVSGTINDQVAKICYHAGVAVSMYWGCDGSGAQSSAIVTALKNYFKYSTSVQLIKKSNYTDANWKTALRNQLDQGKPMVYVGDPSSGAGHAWNCDGYQGTTHFHMNWGWGGSGNGFYTLENLTSSATPGGPDYNFIYNQEAIINIYPRDTYPLYCNQNINLTGYTGAFNDGSVNLDYQNNFNCTYTINPECGAVVQLKFESFDLAAGDELRLHDGPNTDSPLIDTYTSSNPPGTGLITSDKGGMCLQFVTDGAETAAGWDVAYTVKNCKTNIQATEPSGTINDGSGPCNYSNSSVCSWFVQPPGATWISFNFTEFDLAGTLDYVKIYKNAIGASNLIAEFNANNQPSSEIVVESGVAVVQFFADANNNSAGWTVNYNSSLTDVEDISLKPIVQIYPNPSDGNLDINYYGQGSSSADVSITDVTGKTLYKISQNSNNSIFKFHIGDGEAVRLSDGIYFLEIRSGEIIHTEKIIISR